MAVARSFPAAGGRTVEVRCTDRADGDLAADGEPIGLAERRRAVVDLPWAWLRQVHGAEVVVVDDPAAAAGEVADAAVTAVPGAVLAVHTADCAPVLLWSTEGEPVVGAAHAGWRGLYEGVVEATVAAMRELGADGLRWCLGPHIGPAAYEFSTPDLTTMALRFGPEVVAATPDGRPALDLAAGVRAAVAASGVDPGAGERVGGCTASELDEGGTPRWFSHRSRRDVGRQASVIWIAP